MRPKTRSITAILVVLLTIWTIRKLISSDVSRRKPRQYSAKPGWIKPRYYKKDDPVEILINKIDSDQSNIPYGYRDLPFVCPPSEGKKPLHSSLSEIIGGDRKWQSDYNLRFGVDVECEILCGRKTQPNALKKADALIRKDYKAHWLIDSDMPAATTFIQARSGKKYYSEGFPIGVLDPETDKTYLHNHVMLVIRYHSADINKHTIVGFEVYPKSISDYNCPGGSKDYSHYEIKVDETETTFIPFTYSVYWREEFHNDWSHRWSFFMAREKSETFRLLPFAKSIIVLTLMTFIVTVAIAKIRSDRSMRLVAFSWTSHPARFLSLLNLSTAMGVQFLFSLFGALVISCSLSKFHDIINGVAPTATLFFVLGAYASSFLGTLLAPETQATLGVSVICGCALSGSTLIVLAVLNSIIWAKEATDHLPFEIIVITLACYFVICGPVSVFGGLTARKMRTGAHKIAEDTSPLKFLLAMNYEGQGTDSTLTRKPLPKALSNPLLYHLVCGAPPFIVIWSEVSTVYKSVWLKSTGFYTLYGFLLANFATLCITVIEVSIVACYLLVFHGQSGDSSKSGQFKNGNSKNSRQTLSSLLRGRPSARSLLKVVRYFIDVSAAQLELVCSSWRWKCFLAGSSVAWYFEVFSLYYLIFVLRLKDFSSIALFICYTALFNFMCWCAFGALGYLSCLWLLNYVSGLRKAR
ncbi:LAFA_0D05248g1_1 [Lachancea sp. 'fantastica']|nr:LAFA_0D05248g1_1 [Lachancea sp. 'fantastica']